jgi:hypothetical protein
MPNKCGKISSKSEYFFLGMGQYGCTVKNSDFYSKFTVELKNSFQEKYIERKLYPNNRFVWGIGEFLEKTVFVGLSFFGTLFPKYSLRSKIGVNILTPMLTYFEKKMFVLRKDSFSHKNMKSAAQR